MQFAYSLREGVALACLAATCSHQIGAPTNMVATKCINSYNAGYEYGRRSFVLNTIASLRVCPSVQVSTQHGTGIPVGTLPTCVRRSWSPTPGRGELDIPLVNLSTNRGRAFAYAGPTSWNSLPDNLKNVNLSLQSFKRHLKTFFFSSY